MNGNEAIIVRERSHRGLVRLENPGVDSWNRGSGVPETPATRAILGMFGLAHATSWRWISIRWMARVWKSVLGGEAMKLFVVGLLGFVMMIGADKVQTWNFERDEPGRVAKGFTNEVGRWEVVATQEGRVLAQKAENPDATFNVALVSGSSAKDLNLTVRVKPVSGKEDQGGGLVWRARDSKNYYIARYNPLEDNFRVYKVVDGIRTMLQDSRALRESGWRSIRVVMKGDHIECFLDGKKLLDVHDSTWTEAGRVGLWSKADAQSYFDDLTLEAVEDRPGKE